MMKKQLIVTDAVVFIILLLNVIVPELSFRKHRDEYREVTGVITAVKVDEGNRKSLDNYYAEVEYVSDSGEKCTAHRVPLGYNEEKGDTIVFYLGVLDRAYRGGILKFDTFILLRTGILFLIVVTITEFIIFKRKQRRTEK